MRIANTAALILAMAPFLAVAQRSGGRLDRKPSPATSATSAPTAQSGAPAAAAAQQSNTRPNIVPGRIQPVPAQPVMRPAAAIPASPTASPVIAPLAATSVPAAGCPAGSKRSAQHLNQQPTFIIRKDN